jgi:hypothetical protein
MAQMNDEERACILMQAGTIRFDAKAQAFFESLQNPQPSGIFSAYDMCLIPSLAEGLGYGRDRAFFRAAGFHLIGATSSFPEPLGRSPQPTPLDSSRLRILHDLVVQWRTTGAWETFRQTLITTPPNNAYLATRRGGSGEVLGGDACVALGGVGQGDASVPTPTRLRQQRATQASPPLILATPTPTRVSHILHQLRNNFTGLGTARAGILICNIILPFAALVAQQENDSLLAERARNLYISHPGLPSNQITRAMSKQLLLKNEPRGTCQQQGLHFIYAQTCREKRCTECMIGMQGV